MRKKKAEARPEGQYRELAFWPMKVLWSAGTRTFQEPDLRAHADKLMLTGDFDTGKLLHDLIDSAGGATRLVELKRDLQEVQADLTRAEGIINEARRKTSVLREMLEKAQAPVSQLSALDDVDSVLDRL